MGKGDLLKLVRKLLQDLPALSCEDFRHGKGEHHKFNEECPVYERFEHTLEQLQKIVSKENRKE